VLPGARFADMVAAKGAMEILSDMAPKLPPSKPAAATRPVS
jgi:hypothetical protein